MRILVTGATGFVGSRLVPELLAVGHDVTVLVRDAASYDPPPAAEDSTEFDVVEGDLLEPKSLSASALSADVAYYLVHSMHAGKDFAERDRNAAQNFIDLADQGGIDRIIYLGGLGEEREQLSAHLRSRREVELVLAESEASLTTLRAAIVIGRGSASFEMIRQLASRLPVMITPRWVRTNCQPIAIDDVLAYLVGVLNCPETAGDTYEIGGPDVLTYADILRRTAELLGRRLWIIPVPVLTPELSSYWVGLMTDVPATVARPLIVGLQNPVVVQDTRLQELLAVDRTPFDDAVARALSSTEPSTEERSVLQTSADGLPETDATAEPSGDRQ